SLISGVHYNSMRQCLYERNGVLEKIFPSLRTDHVADRQSHCYGDGEDINESEAIFRSTSLENYQTGYCLTKIPETLRGRATPRGGGESMSSRVVDNRTNPELIRGDSGEGTP
ncbi:hypothetical protein L9F63_023083, partial [Diploptera punctata]